MMNEETKRKISRALTGRTLSKKVRQHMSTAQQQLGKHLSKEHIQKLCAPRVGKPLTEEHKQRIRINQPNYHGGIAITGGGYIKVRVPNHPNADSKGYVLAARVIAEKALGRYLKTEEIVHHIDGNRLNNRNKNLLICKRDYHAALEAKIRREVHVS